MSKSANPIRIKLIENVLINEAGLRCLLDSQPDFQVLKHPHDHDPEVLLMIMNHGKTNGLERVLWITRRHPDANILILCMIEDPYIAKRLIALGVKGVICGHTPPEILFSAIREIAKGKTYIDTAIASAVVVLNNDGDNSPFDTLTLRELEITCLMLNGLTQKEVGEHLFISAHTVANHHTRILKKLCVSNHIELTKLAIRHGLTSV